MTDTETPAPGPAYSYRPSLMGPPYTFRLAPDAIEWQLGQRSGRITYAAVRRVRLSFRPVPLQTYRFLTEIWSDKPPKLQIASTSTRSMMEVERHDASYADFVTELHRRIAAAGGEAVFESGKNPIVYWIGFVLFVMVVVGFAGLAVRGLQEGSLAGAAFVAAFLALFLWQMGGFFRRNRPRRYTADALPADLLPR
jgi:hypothetical protein